MYQRIADSGLKLFSANGYEATTLEAIAEAAEISRRTFFYYFKSKEDILLKWHSDLPSALRNEILIHAADQSPVDIIRDANLKLVSYISTDQAIAIDRILRSSEQLRTSNHAKYLELEQVAFDALCELWPQIERRIALRVAAMTSVGTVRIAIDRWAEDGRHASLAEYINEAFVALRAELANT